MTVPTLVPVDPLGVALHFLRMTGVFTARSEFTEPWALALPKLPGFLMFHVVLAGHAHLDVRGESRRLLRAGDFALVPHGEGHRLSSAPGVRAAKLFDLPRVEAGDRYEVIRHGGGGAPTTLLCGAVTFDHPVATRLVELLPRTICVEAARARHPGWLQSTLEVMAAEARELRPGGETVLTRLADILVIQAIRSYLETGAGARTESGSARPGWLGALRDRQIGRALAAVHREPSRPWSLPALAAEAAMSRSAFSARFTELVGEPAMQYVGRFRMLVARTRLEETDARLAEIASELGYLSEAAFCRAFKRFLGVSPGAVRRSLKLRRAR